MTRQNTAEFSEWDRPNDTEITIHKMVIVKKLNVGNHRIDFTL